MFDLHNHLLPGVDDGAKDWDMAIAMAKMAYADGIRGLVFTPHNSAWWNNYYQEKIERLTREFRQQLHEEGLELQVGPGAEIYIDTDILKRLKDGRAAALNCSRYLLVELPLNSWPMSTEYVFFELQAAGYLPIMAHPERNADIMRKPELMQGLAERGVIGQITAGSLEGKFGRHAQKIALKLLANRWAHFIASDAHDLTARPPKMREAFKIVEAFFDTARATAMTQTIPEKIFHNEELFLEPPIGTEYEEPSPTSRGWLGSLFKRRSSGDEA